MEKLGTWNARNITRGAGVGETGKSKKFTQKFTAASGPSP